jgi:hypothetical protein
VQLMLIIRACICRPYVVSHNLYASSNIVSDQRNMTWGAGHLSLMDEMRNVYKILVGIAGEKSTLRRHRRRWKCNIRRDLKRRMGKCPDSCGSG